MTAGSRQQVETAANSRQQAAGRPWVLEASLFCPAEKVRISAKYRSFIQSLPAACCRPPAGSKATLRWLTDTNGDMVEGALTFPLLALVTLALVNLALAGFASVTANNAVNYATRMASVDQTNPAGRAFSTASDALQSTVGSYAVRVEQADSHAGGRVAVRVSWEVPNFFAGLMPLFGASAGPIQGEAYGVFRKEGW